MKLEEALRMAGVVKSELAPHCEAIEITGGVRQKAPEVCAIEFVIVPKSYQVGLFASGIAVVLDKYAKIQGELPCNIVRRQFEGIELDVYITDSRSLGLMMAITTGQDRYIQALVSRWEKRGYITRGGMLTYKGNQIAVYTEEKLFALLGLKWIEPEKRFL